MNGVSTLRSLINGTLYYNALTSQVNIEACQLWCFAYESAEVYNRDVVLIADSRCDGGFAGEAVCTKRSNVRELERLGGRHPRETAARTAASAEYTPAYFRGTTFAAEADSLIAISIIFLEWRDQERC